MAQQNADVDILDQGSIVIFTPLSDEAKEWFADNVEGPNWGAGYACDHRPAQDIAQGLAAEGFTVQ